MPDPLPMRGPTPESDPASESGSTPVPAPGAMAEPEPAPQPFRCGRVAVVGRPNVGKSTLVNRLVGARVSVTSRKAQTTRQRVGGILTLPRAQIVFVDTPGFQTRYRAALHQRMNRAVIDSLADVDLALWVVEAGRLGPADRDVLRVLPPELPVIAAVNKTDRLGDRNLLLPYLARLAGEREFAALVPISAERGTQLDDLLATIVPLLPAGPPLHAADDFTDRDERFLASEFLREKVFRQMGDEVPYATAVVIDRFEQEGDLRRIHATVYVERAAQRAILLGEGGARMKRIATDARKEMERSFGGTVFLEVWVRVKRGWADDEVALRRLGLD